jgi:F-type H+-transporting ATPase subunit b
MQRARLFQFVALAVALVLGVACAVRAGGHHDDPKQKDTKKAEGHHDGGDKKKASGGGDHGDGGQKDAKHGDEPAKLDIFAGALDLGIWTVVVFLILLFVLTRYAWKPMLEGLRKREESIRGAVEEAKIARAETHRMQAEFEKKLEDAHQEIPKLMEEARRKAQEMAEEMRAKANSDIAAERQRLRREIDTATDQALQQIYTSAADVAADIATRAIGRSLTPEDQHRLVEEAMNELREAGQKRLEETKHGAYS